MRELIEQIEEERAEMGKLALQYGLKDLRVIEKSQELDELLNRHLGLGPGAPQHRQGNGGFQRLCRR